DDKPPNLIKIPCCKDCNQKYDPLDEKMSNYIAILADEKSFDVAEKAKKVVLTCKKLSEQFLACTK
ncbi:MAG: hypothetical protein JXB48_21660, partial [Candidatus Latescibacteria bacterium]|nr:hypothetical protein [Candidatus Latescibacterota bacterium]